MPDDLGLFAPAANPGGRYDARTGSAPWTTVDRLLLYPVLAACGSEFSYREACVWLCVFLGRSPVFPPGKRPLRSEVQSAAVKILERKTVTEGLTEDWILLPLARRATDGRRTGLPLSWAEVRLVRSYHAKRKVMATKKGDELAITPNGLLTLLNRTADDLAVLGELFATLSQGPLDDPGEDRSAHPTAASQELTLAKALTRVRSIGEVEGSDFSLAWAGLYDVLGGLNSATLR